ncbi:cysteine--tRNA ligase [Spiroplasma endosymbiont of Polydrusus pterygomalis]|uniref:cysteine--tRNA ligase n=1 Tax=Spiroplasma endosymbiont of Polydrusus pterygomalis TaxID=3139327 RepID=UPI003CCAC635
MIKIYDSFLQTIQPLAPNKEKINMYLCGPTVYNYIHVGNVRGILVFDVLHRLLIHQKYKINYVHNITDIDDKIIKKAAELKIAEQEVATKYTIAYVKDLEKLNIILPTKLPKVSDYIPKIIEFINSLISKNYAYITNGDVYFKVSKLKDYGALAHKNIEDLILNFRVSSLANKENALDFALWKSTTVGINWNSPWGKGRPGWHTECACFIEKIFNGQTIDLHGGGIDLKFPHHENERAQFMAINNKEMANIWWHNGHVNIANTKMSKSLNNFILVKEFCQQYHSNVLRYLILNRDHQQPINFNKETIENGIASVKKYENVLKQCTYQIFINNIIVEYHHHVNYYHQVIKNLSNNIDTTNTITLLENMIKKLNEAIIKKTFSKEFQEIFYTFTFTLNILGFDFKFGDYSKEVKSKIKMWEQLKQQKNYEEADKIRQELKDLNII